MDSYSFVRVVGKGSYGEVNLVRHRSDRKQYVIKKLNLRTSSRRERRAAEQEAQLLSQLKHPNIVTYRESWEGEDCQLYIVMGFCEGGDLYHRLKQQKGELLPERQVVEWFVQIAMALQYLHEKHILHRDLKTQNIFLTKTSIIKVGDLGIARVLESQNDMASTLIGTPYYMSPELFSNKPYNYKSDVWALGCCVYEMATLKHAFNAKDMNSLVYRIVEGKLPQMPSKYDPHLGELIKRMLCKKPEDRPDVKHILRQPYIKQQISRFLEATKEKTAKSRKNAANSKPGSAGSDASTKPNHDAVQPQCLNSESKARGRKVEENHLNRQKPCNGAVEKVLLNPHLPPKSPSRDIFNSTGPSTATISNIDVEIQSQEQKQRKAKKPSSHQNHKPLPVSKRREKEEKEDPAPTQALGVSRAEDKMSANGLISQNSTTPKPADRTKTLSKNQALNASMDLKDDTMKLLREAGMEDIPYDPVEQHHNAETKSESHRKTVDDNLSNACCVLKDVPTGSSTEESEGSLDSTEKLLKPVPDILMESASALSDQSRPVLQPSSSSSEPSMSRQRRQKKDKSLDDQNSHQPSSVDIAQVKAVPRPLPPLPEDVPSVNNEQKGHSEKNRPANLSSSTKNCPEQQYRPLSARERRRLKQSQENARQQAVSAVKRVPCDVPSLDGKQTDHPDCPRPASTTLETRKERKCSWRQSDDEDCSSSTSSTERSEGDYRERKFETNEMQDLVQMMTQTLHMDARGVSFEPDGSRCHSTPLPEFKLNRKYRDTLMLHGKSREGQGDNQISGFPLDDSTGPAKVRRVIEHLRTDVVKGLGVKLLDRVLDIMQQEDEEKREHLLQELMGEEKYKQYAVKVQQLKFFEDVAFKD
ncbi:serine/threonine-protein kinase Nek4-like isoform X1 [Carassius auratus]|uniref:Serine/threonine-protein kinase Nek4 n=1 Tax=Carassius auratus TaxID=7957 RepID=A0A6P6MP02_CARAU|nr:serine/threonine-protein kinase Nek4-like isoform X1 [Carassius auratus]